MLFKRLELWGFKSFATRTFIDFLPGVTIFVGPNGVGKSNILDAIKWVLGEQSARSLRGARMGDVIFNGSVTQKLANFAQVSLTITNEEGLLPAGFDELVITRRLFRTGESEYMINKVPCRLKDIVDLFRDTGIGTTAYSVMEQGEVDFIINARPPERRSIFEEAAGVSRYKARKEEALRKLEGVERDLVRLNDIITEVKRNTNALKRQALKARRYKELIQEQKTLDMKLLAQRYRLLREQKIEMEKQYRETKAGLEQLAVLFEGVKSQNVESNKKLEQLQQQANQTRAKALTLQSELEKTEQEIDFLDAQRHTAEKRSQELTDQLDFIKKQLRAGSSQHQQLQQERKSLSQKLQNVETKLQEKEKLIATIVGKGKDKTLLVENVQKKLGKLRQQRTEHEGEIRLADALIAKLEETIDNNKEALKNVTAERDRLRQIIQQKTTKRKQLAKKSQALKEATANLEQQINSLSKELKQAEAKRAKLTQAYQQAQSRLNVMRQMQQSYEGYKRGVKAIMSSKELKSTAGIKSTLAEIMKVAPGFEPAIEVTLENKLQCMITKNVGGALKAIDYLITTRAGQAGFLPLEMAEIIKKDSQLEKIKGLRGVIGSALDKVEFSHELEPVVNMLLARVVIVREKAVALKLAREFKNYTFVTQDGQLVAEKGRLLGGRYEPDGLFSRQTQVEQLLKQISALRQDEKAVSQRVKQLEDRTKRLGDSKERKDKELYECDLSNNELEQEIKNGQQSLERLSKEVAELQARIEPQEKEAAQLKSKKARLTQLLAESEEAIKGLEANLQSYKQQAVMEKNQLAELQQEITDARLKIVTMKEKIVALEDKSSALEAQNTRYAADQKQKNKEIDSLKLELDSITQKQKTAKQRIKELGRGKDQVESLLQSYNNEKELLDTELKGQSEQLHQLQRDRNELENQMQELRIKQAQLQAQEEAIGQQAKDKFSISPADLAEHIKADEVIDENQLLFQLNEIQDKLGKIGTINPLALEEYEQQEARYSFLIQQQQDLLEAKESLQKTITKLDTTSTRLFDRAFSKIAENFKETFRELFGGGRAELVLLQTEGGEPGVDIVAQPPGKKLQTISLLSGGERALAAIALMFAIFKFKPTPFCVLDEIDAPLDDANIVRYKDLLHRFSKNTQFIIITHNKGTMTMADSLVGVTMQEPGVSKLVSVRFDRLEELKLVG